MSKIGSVSFVEKSLKENQFKIKKKFGQNFLTDASVLKNIVDASDVTKTDAVIEIGPGLGALTELLCERAGFVLAYEIDYELLPILEKNLNGFSNYKVILKDVLEADVLQDIKLYLKEYKNIYVVANLPYYITTPILLGLLSKNLPIKHYVMMMQLEVANRICGKPETKDYNALSIWIEYKAKATKICKVPRTVFVPSPNVDSAVIRLDVYDTLPIKALDEENFSKLIRQSFAQRRKTIFNNLSLAYDKRLVTEMLESLGISPSVRAEALTTKDFVEMSNYLTQKLN
ncbi:MAG: 16S rRNA (adenine(1518)-N(6)/adenine(1519)-N(6))-dimethyltransferase RsmA [Roseburia sp.]|nr:16S rRNA (adenine(1518)-N(6)/adenine(1519)-N(6))-dimethyltransferase RsmA [Anaeroplasma bactoclasticum]MCM1196291.1 16S rRNA (adenine(1518)-N(6)/adenine(1519)-N(6))-dimethyltransferase RsmA [Roseburia sp.]MCM1557458.1 16S rRNA (adenine(1518)-N(6)/adenine(1519)-N(6))-dimethyltransferase RsmA [Anaeroplasma bactoclasticum]